MVKLSIIIPLYNTENYIAKCIQSCIDQTVSKETYEIIVVNDGSTDNSLKIAQSFIDQHPKIKIISQENKKQGAARNTGLKTAKGKYVWFIDSDDWIEPNSLCEIYNYLEQNSVEILGFDAIEHDSNKSKLRIRKHIPNYIYKANEALLEDEFNVNFPLHIFKKSLLIDNCLFFLEGIFFEDNELMIKILAKTDSFVYLKKYFYNILVREGSTTRTKDPQRYLDFLVVIRSLLKHLQTTSLDLSARKVFSKHLSRYMNSLLIGVSDSTEIFHYAVTSLVNTVGLEECINNSGLCFHKLEYRCLKFPNLLQRLLLFYYHKRL